METNKDNHESYGMISIAKFNGKSQFFGSDLEHGGGISITISKGEVERKLFSEWYYGGEEMIHQRPVRFTIALRIWRRRLPRRKN